MMQASVMRVMWRTDARQREQAVRSGSTGKPCPFLSSQPMTRAAKASPVDTPTPFSRANESQNRLQNAMCLCSKPTSTDTRDRERQRLFMKVMMKMTMKSSYQVG